MIARRKAFDENKWKKNITRNAHLIFHSWYVLFFEFWHLLFSIFSPDSYDLFQLNLKKKIASKNTKLPILLKSFFEKIFQEATEMVLVESISFEWEYDRIRSFH